MCGICGRSEDRAGEAVRAMNAALRHRGPDDDGILVDAETGTALGATRLSIIDVAGGHQPLANEDGKIVAALNGEIYNHRSLMDTLRGRGHELATRVDTEVLVHLYEDYGDDLVHALDGMYAFALWDAPRRRLLLARDRFGEKPLFYRVAGGVLTWASELTALLAGSAADGRPAIDARSLDAFFVLGYVPGPRTMAEGVFQLPPGHVLTWEDGRADVRPYWRPPALTAFYERGDDELVAEVDALLRDAVRSRMVADVPLGVFLSGGLDSTLVTSLAAELSDHPVQSFTVGYDVGGVNETSPAAVSASRIGTDHHELVVRAADVEAIARSLYGRLDQPIADQALLASHAVSAFAREHVKVVVGGEGADELFGGYPRYRWLALAEDLQRRVPTPVGRATAAAVRSARFGGRARRLSNVLEPQPAVERHLDWVTDGRLGAREGLYGARLTAAYGPDDLSARLDERVDTARRFMLNDQVTWLPDDVLAKADRASMLASLEVRTPFLEPRLAELAAAVPTARHLAHGGKSLLRAVLEDRLPAARRGRSKVAFRVPAAEWLRGPLAPVLEAQWEANPLFDDGWMDRGAARRLLDEHRAGAHDRSAVLWPLMVLAFWFESAGGSLGA